MACDWSAYLGLAEELALRADNEAAMRSAMSHAYYTAFGTAADHLRRRGIAVPVVKSHAFVWRTFRHTPDPRHVEIGLQLDRLRQWREAADYAADYPGDFHEDTREAVRRARSVVDAIRRLTGLVFVARGSGIACPRRLCGCG